jgi:predicted GIY-YIG superfamily endonuclease
MTLLLSHLKEYRQLRSAADKTPLYSVFGDTVMRSISQTRPTTRQALTQIRGLSPEKCELYGEDILRIVKAVREPSMVERSPPSVVLRHQHHPQYHRNPQASRRCPLPRTFDPSQAVNVTSQRIRGKPVMEREGIYILELAQGRVYVGHSSDMKRRLQQHMSGQGAAFTKAFPPTGVLLPRLGMVTGSSEAAERDETLRYMFLRGIPLVRGWKFTRVHMAEDEQRDAEENIRELFDLCRRCGHPGHFITQCKANFDRNGRPCK